MKNLKTFENYEYGPYSGFIKNYGDPYPLTKISVGDLVTYIGTVFRVEEITPYAMKLRTLDGVKTINVNQNMFDQKGAIVKDYSKSLL